MNYQYYELCEVLVAYQDRLVDDWGHTAFLDYFPIQG